LADLGLNDTERNASKVTAPRRVPGSNVDRNINYLKTVRRFSQCLQVNSGIVPTTLAHDGFLPSFPIHHLHTKLPFNAI
jgi:hypothetical protein